MSSYIGDGANLTTYRSAIQHATKGLIFQSLQKILVSTFLKDKYQIFLREKLGRNERFLPHGDGANLTTYRRAIQHATKGLICQSVTKDLVRTSLKDKYEIFLRVKLDRNDRCLPILVTEQT